jgi:hypothetical protein
MLHYVYFSVKQRLYLGDDVGYLGVMASLEGFEPTTRCLEGSRSIQLSYRDSTASTL